MSKFLYVIYNKSDLHHNEAHLKNKFSKLFQLPHTAVTSFSKENKSLFIINSSPNTIVTANLDYSISFPGKENTAGNYLSVKHGEESIEAKADAAGTRVLWYYFDQSKMILSGSQRMIVAMLGNFSANEKAWSWMLANGAIGPGLSWDERINALAAGSTLILNAKDWKLNISSSAFVFDYGVSGKASYRSQLSDLFENIKPDYFLNNEKSLLTLSGGYDSRAALYLLKENNHHLHTATWGVPSAFKAPFSDATVAAAVSKAWHTNHTEHNVQLLNDFETILHTFLIYTEGRNDHINSFMDGLNMWKEVASRDFKYIIRADEAFGWLPVKTALDVRTSVAMAKFSDYKNIPHNVIASLPELEIPAYLDRRDNEIIEDYRDRIYQQYRLPFVIGALQDGPLTFLEFINPLLHPELLAFVKQLPPHLRTSKKLYASWVDKLLPGISYAKTPAIPEAYHIALSPHNAKILIAFINDDSTINSLGSEFVTFIKNNFKPQADNTNKTGSPLRTSVKRLFPSALKKLVRNYITGYEMNIGSLVLRAYIICMMQKLMKDSAE